MTARVFTSAPARRRNVSMFIGLAGCAGSGKTYSALELATGMVGDSGKPVYFIDTQNGRALYYAERFDFQHVPFDAPYSPNDYDAAIGHCVAQGAGVIIIDSMSHEHTGENGVLDAHDAAERQGKKGMQAWKVAKDPRKRLLERIRLIKSHLIFCFEGKDKLVNGKSIGWCPIGGGEYSFAMDVMAVLPPGSNGVPDWSPKLSGTALHTKRPYHLAGMLKDGGQLSRDTGAALAKWAAGAKPVPQTQATPVERIISAFLSAPDDDAIKAIKKPINIGAYSPADQKAIKEAFGGAVARIKTT